MANELEKANPALQIARITHTLFSILSNEQRVIYHWEEVLLTTDKV